MTTGAVHDEISTCNGIRWIQLGCLATGEGILQQARVHTHRQHLAEESDRLLAYTLWVPNIAVDDLIERQCRVAPFELGLKVPRAQHQLSADGVLGGYDFWVYALHVHLGKA